MHNDLKKDSLIKYFFFAWLVLNQLLELDIALRMIKFSSKCLKRISHEKAKRSNLQINSPAEFVPGASCLYLIHFWLPLSSSHGDTLRNPCQVLAGCWNGCTGPWWVSEDRTSPQVWVPLSRGSSDLVHAVLEDPLCSWLIGTVSLLPSHRSIKAIWSLSTFRAWF